MLSSTTRRARLLRSMFALAAAALVAVGCGPDDSSSAKGAAGETDATITLVAYSTPREAFAELIPAFRESAQGAGVEVRESYGASGDQSRAVENGLEADVVDLSLAPDLTRLVDAGLIAEDWNENEHEGMLTDSVVVLVVRPGNPKRIQHWNDLLAKDVEVVTPNPFTSGGARWNLMAAYGAWTRNGDSPATALDKLERLLRNTPVQPTSAREALQVFSQGKGDVMLAYENEAITAQRKGEELDFVVPDSTILIENPAAVLKASEAPKAARAFLDFALSADGQRIFAKHGYRPVLESVADEFDFPQPKGLFTIDDLGGWDSVMDEFFDREDGKVADIAKELGIATEK